MAETVVEMPFGKLVPTVKKNNDGKITEVSYRGSSQDLRAWEQKEYGIDDAQRNAIKRRNKELAMQMSDFLVKEGKRIIKEGAVPEATVDVKLGMGDGAEEYKLQLSKDVHFPIEKEDGTRETGTKKVFGVYTIKVQKKLEKDIREHHEPGAKSIEEAMEAMMAKASVK